MSIKENILRFINEVPDDIKIIAVSKTKTEDDIMKAYDVGQKIFGENKVQELVRKYENLPKDIEWHMIGHMQSNKVKYLAPFVSLIHGVDSFKLLKVINKEGEKNNRKIDCLLQFHIAKEETKFGFNLEECIEMLESDEFKELNNIRMVGVMGMATNTKNSTQVKEEFSNLKNIFNHVHSNFLKDNHFAIISMGMSNDYPFAIEEGSNMIRVGSSIFGSRS